VIAKQQALHDELSALGASEEQAAALEARLAAARQDFLAAARALSRRARPPPCRSRRRSKPASRRSRCRRCRVESA
jgi:hypothetical protein